MVRLLTQKGGEHLADRIVGTTPFGNNNRRGHECLQWLIDHNHQNAKWLAIDDDSLLFIGLEGHFLKTDPKTGLTKEDAKQIIRYFVGDT